MVITRVSSSSLKFWPRAFSAGLVFLQGSDCYSEQIISGAKAISYIQLPRYNRGGKEYKKAVATARALVHERLKHFNQIYKVRIGRINIRKQRTKWGSASSLGNLNFNYRIAFLPEEIRDYIIVHELCHLLEPNHSKAFWAQVARVFPNHRILRRELRRYRF